MIWKDDPPGRAAPQVSPSGGADTLSGERQRMENHLTAKAGA